MTGVQVRFLPPHPNERGEMKALSIRQPWAQLIAIGAKDIENRTWRTSFTGRIYIHTGQRFDPHALEWLLSHGVSPWKSLVLHTRKLIPTGGIIGEVDITGCVTESESLWFEGPYGLTLANPTLYPRLVPWKGHLGLFDVPDVIAATVSDFTWEMEVKGEEEP